MRSRVVLDLNLGAINQHFLGVDFFPVIFNMTFAMAIGVEILPVFALSSQRQERLTSYLRIAISIKSCLTKQ